MRYEAGREWKLAQRDLQSRRLRFVQINHARPNTKPCERDLKLRPAPRLEPFCWVPTPWYRLAESIPSPDGQTECRLHALRHSILELV